MIALTKKKKQQIPLARRPQVALKIFSSKPRHRFLFFQLCMTKLWLTLVLICTSKKKLYNQSPSVNLTQAKTFQEENHPASGSRSMCSFVCLFGSSLVFVNTRLVYHLSRLNFPMLPPISGTTALKHWPDCIVIFPSCEFY